MKGELSKSKAIRLASNGFLVGLVALLLAFFVEAFRTNNAISFSGFVDVHRSNPLFFFLDVIPFFFAFLAYSFGGKAALKIADAERYLEEDESRKRRLYRFVERIRNGEIDADFEADEGDALGKAIVNLRDNLKSSKIEEAERKKEDMLSFEPNLIDGYKVEFLVANNLQKEEVENVFKELQYYLRKNLSNRQVELTVDLSDVVQKSIIYTPEDKFKHMSQKNQALILLRQQMNLDFE